MSPKMGRNSTELLDIARAVRARAYSPYSKFSVGAAVETADGQIFEGCNIENASYGLTVCAERVAIFRAITAGQNKFSKIAISCPPASPTAQHSQMPCGACRQVMAEFADQNLVIIVDGVGEFTLRDLLPSPFHL